MASKGYASVWMRNRKEARGGHEPHGLFLSLPFRGVMLENLPGWAIEALKQFPVIVIVLVVQGFLAKYIVKQHQAHLESKDKEIDRLVQEKNKLKDQRDKQKSFQT